MAEATHEPPMSRATSLLAHSIPLLMVVAVTARAVWLLHLVSAFSALDTFSSLALMIGVVALVFHLRNGGLCLRCIRNTPLNPQLAVNRNKFFLWVIHLQGKRFWLTLGACQLVVLLGAAYASGFILTLTKLPLDVMFFSMMWAAWQHHRLEPWCPYCRGWDEGGEEEVVPDPDPAEKGVR